MPGDGLVEVGEQVAKSGGLAGRERRAEERDLRESVVEVVAKSPNKSGTSARPTEWKVTTWLPFRTQG